MTRPPQAFAGEDAPAAVPRRREAFAWALFRALTRAARWLPPRGAEALLRPTAALAVRGVPWAGWARAAARNQQVVHGGRLDAAAVRALVRGALCTRLRAQYESLHFAHRADRLHALIRLAPETDEWIQTQAAGSRGVMVVGPHVGHFDLMGRALVRRLPRMMALVAPEDRLGYAVDNRARREAGIDIVPVSAAGLRRALAHLRAGGTAVTGMDWPLPGVAIRPLFFGRPAPIPLSPLRLAARAGVPVAVLSALRDPDGRYTVRLAGPFDVRLERNDPEALLAAAAPILHHVEAPIRAAPEQWTMFRPVWPDGEHDTGEAS